MRDKIIRIFVSSTFEDLIYERNALNNEVFPKLEKYCSAQGWQFHAVDLRWGISTEAGINQRTMQICLKEIERCQKTSPKPNFLVLLGDRYGWRPLPETLPNADVVDMQRKWSRADKRLFKKWYRCDENAHPEPLWVLQRIPEKYQQDYQKYEHKAVAPLSRKFREYAGTLETNDPRCLYLERSATEQEIATGALSMQADHVLTFVRNINGTDRSEIASRYYEHSPESHALLQNLKRRLKQHLPDSGYITYDSQWDAEINEISQDHISLFCDQVFTSLKEIVDSVITGYDDGNTLEKENHHHAQFEQNRIQGFHGRQQEIKAICSHAGRACGKPLIVCGKSGVGKSALMAKAAQHLSAQFPKMIRRYIGATAQSSNGTMLIKTLCDELGRLIGGFKPAQGDYHQLKNEFLRRLAHANSPLVILIDALDQLQQSDSAYTLDWLPFELPDHVVLVCSILPGEQFDRIQTSRDFELLTVGKLPHVDAEAALSDLLISAGRTITAPQKKAIMDGFSGSGQNALYLRLAVGEALLWHSYDEGIHLPNDLAALINSILDRLSRPDEHGAALVKKALTYISCAKQGLSDREVTEILAADPKYWASFIEKTKQTNQQLPPKKNDGKNQLPFVIWSRLYHDIESFMTKRQVAGGEVIDFYHRQVRETAARRYLHEPAEQSVHHQRIADYFDDMPDFYHSDAEDQTTRAQDATSPPNARKCDELTYHLSRSMQTERIESLLLDIRYLLAKTSAFGPGELISDFDYIIDGAPRAYKLIQSAIKQSAHFLQDDKNQLPMQLLARLRRSTSPVVQTLRESIDGWTSRPWLRPMNLCFPPPDGPLLRTIEAFSSREDIETILSDGQDIVFVSDDSASRKMLKIWKLETGTRAGTFHIPVVEFAICSKYTVTYSAKAHLDVWENKSGRRIHTLAGHTQAVMHAIISKDGSRAISAALDDTVKVWDLASKQCLRTLSAQDEVTQLQFSEDETRFVFRCQNTATVADSETGEPLTQITLQKIPVDPDDPVDFQLSLQHAAVLHDNTVYVYRVKSGKLKNRIVCDSADIVAFSLAPRGQRLVTGLSDHTLQVWDLKTGESIHTLYGHKMRLTDLDWHANIVCTSNGRFALTTSIDGMIKVWDIRKGTYVNTLLGHSCEIKAMCLTPDEMTAISASADGMVNIWDYQRKSKLSDNRDHTHAVTIIQAANNSRVAVSVSDHHNIDVWMFQYSMCRYTLREHRQTINDIVITPDSHKIVSCSEDETIKVWEVKSGKCLQTLYGHTGSVTAIAVSADSKTVFSGGADCTLRVWDIETGACRQTFTGHENEIHRLIVSPDHRFMVSVDARFLFIWNLQTGKQLTKQSIAANLSTDHSVVLSPDGQRVVFIAKDRTVGFFDFSSRKANHLSRKGRIFTDAKPTPDGQKLITCSYKTAGALKPSVALWDVNNQTELYTEDGNYTRIAFSPCSRYAVVQSTAQSAYIWDIEQSKRQPLEKVAVFEISPDGLSVVTGSDDLIRVFDIRDGEQIARFQTNAAVTNIAVSPDSKRIIAGDDANWVYILRIENPREKSAPIVTAWHSDGTHAFFCPHPKCRRWVQIAPETAGGYMDCPECRKRVRRTPFTLSADWRACDWRAQQSAQPAQPRPKRVMDEALYAQSDAAAIVQILQDFGIETKVVDIIKGKALTRYDLLVMDPAKTRMAAQLDNDICLHLFKLHVSIKIIDNGRISVIVPNEKLERFEYSEMIAEPKLDQDRRYLPVCIGQDVYGNNHVVNICDMPHLLIGMNFGSGVDYFRDALIASIVERYSPEEVSLALIDHIRFDEGSDVILFKKWMNAPHLHCPVVVDIEQAFSLLGELQQLVTQRKQLFSNKNVNNIHEYNAEMSGPVAADPERSSMFESNNGSLPIIVVMFPLKSYFDSDCVRGENAVCNLAETGAAAGIHMITETAYLHPDLLTDRLKKCFVSKMAYRQVTSSDSDQLLGYPDAADLIERTNDLLYMVEGTPPIRLLGASINDDHAAEICSAAETAHRKKVRRQELLGKLGPGQLPLIEQAIDIVCESDSVSASILARKLRINHSIAAIVLERLAHIGVVAQWRLEQGDKERIEAAVSKEQAYEFLKAHESLFAQSDDVKEQITQVRIANFELLNLLYSAESVSVAQLQRKRMLGYRSAKSVMDQLIALGIVQEPDQTGKKVFLVSKEQAVEILTEYNQPLLPAYQPAETSLFDYPGLKKALDVLYRLAHVVPADLQREMGISYIAATRLMAQLSELENVVVPNRTMPRERAVLVNRSEAHELLHHFLNS